MKFSLDDVVVAGAGVDDGDGGGVVSRQNKGKDGEIDIAALNAGLQAAEVESAVVLPEFAAGVAVLQEDEEIALAAALVEFAAVDAGDDAGHEALVGGEFGGGEFDVPAEAGLGRLGEPLIERVFGESRVETGQGGGLQGQQEREGAETPRHVLAEAAATTGASGVSCASPWLAHRRTRDASAFPHRTTVR